jgi:hypothetical protein
MKIPRSKLALLVATAGLTACVSTQQTADVKRGAVSVETSSQLVTSLDLSQTVGEVGRPFASRMVHTDNYIDTAEYSVSTMPPGLSFDASSGTITGVPTTPGFYRINLAVRERVAKDSLRPSPDHRWWTGDVELAIYNPIE